MFTSLKFIRKVIARFAIILFRRHRTLRTMEFNYTKNHLFSNSLVVINYRFQNAIYYKVGNRTTTAKRRTIIYLAKVISPVHFVAVGMFSRKVFVLDVVPELDLESSSFTTTIDNMACLYRESEINLQKQIIDDSCLSRNLQLHPPPVKFPGNQIRISNATYNQTDYL